MEIKDFLEKNIFKIDKTINGKKTNKEWFLNHGFEKEYAQILLKTKFIDYKNSSLYERIICILKNIDKEILCLNCNKPTNLCKDAYNKFCSTSCSGKSEDTVKKREQTNIKKYGVKSSSMLDEYKNKNKEYQSNKTKDERIEIEEKRKQTCINKYGENYIDILKQKEKYANLKKYGVESTFSLPQVREKRKQTNIEKYGVEYPLSLKQIQDKIEKTSLIKYGETRFTKTLEFKKRNKIILLKRFYNEIIVNLENFTPLFTEEDYLGSRELHKFKCNKCFNEFENNLANGVSSIRCPYCNPYSDNVSDAEKEVVDYIKTLDVDNIVENTRKIISPLELDIYINNYNVAIEFDGIYWHSSSCKEDDMEFRNKHLNKTESCEKQGIQLLHIFENEWNEKQEIWKSIIKSKLGFSNKIAARKCEIVEISNNEKYLFLEQNHLQGEIGSSVNLGLKHNSELVCILIFGKSRFNKKYEWEILRFANKLDTSIIGGFSKLLSYFRKNYKGSIITYADRRYSNGNLYRTNGFVELKSSSPNYFYLKNGTQLFSRMKFQKHKLKDLLENFDDDLSEAENMYTNGYKRIWDCGNKVFALP